MNKILKTVIVGLFAAQALMASPTLQLDILGGSYDDVNENLVNNSNQFSLVALLNDVSLANGDYYLSLAVTPTIANQTPLGSITIDGNVIDVTADMQYGVPPIDDIFLSFDAKDLGKHGVFPTFFTEVAVKFDPSMRTVDYNSADIPGGLAASSTGTMLYKSFAVDVSNLDPSYDIHFDLYDKNYLTAKKTGVITDVDVSKFAPFSHDAQASVIPVPVPEPSVVMMFMFGLGSISLLGFRRKK